MHHPRGSQTLGQNSYRNALESERVLVIPGCYIVRRQPSAEPPLPWYLTDEDTSIVHRACQDLLLPTHLSEIYSSERFACLGKGSLSESLRY